MLHFRLRALRPFCPLGIAFTAAATTGIALMVAPAARAQFVGKNFQTFDPPSATVAGGLGLSDGNGISNNGIVAGDYLAPDKSSFYGYLYQNGSFTTVQYTGQAGTVGNYTILNNVNSSGTSVGYYYDTQSGVETDFIRSSAGVFITPTYSKATSLTYFQTINDLGVVAGQYDDANGLFHGLLYNTNTSTFSTVADAGAGHTFLQQVSANGTLVGSYTDTADGPLSGFVNRNGVLTKFSVAGATSTRFNGINASGIVSGRYIDSGGLSHGLLYNSNNGFFSTFDVPGATETFLFFGSINDSNQVVGTYQDTSGVYHSFTASAVGAPEPSALALLMTGASLAGSTVWARRRRKAS